MESHAGGAPSLGAIGDRRLRYVIVCLLPVLLVFFQHEGAMPVWMVDQLGLSTRNYGLLFTLNTLLIVFLEVRLNSATAHWSAGPRALGGLGAVHRRVRGAGVPHQLLGHRGHGGHLDLRGDDPLPLDRGLRLGARAAGAPRRVHGLLLDDLRHRLHHRPLGRPDRARGGGGTGAVAGLPGGGSAVHAAGGAASAPTLGPRRLPAPSLPADARCGGRHVGSGVPVPKR